MNPGQNVDGQNVDGQKLNNLVLLSLVFHNWLSVTNKLTVTFGRFHPGFLFIHQILSVQSVYQSMSPYLVSYVHLCSSFIHHIYYITFQCRYIPIEHLTWTCLICILHCVYQNLLLNVCKCR